MSATNHSWITFEAVDEMRIRDARLIVSDGIQTWHMRGKGNQGCIPFLSAESPSTLLVWPTLTSTFVRLLNARKILINSIQKLSEFHFFVPVSNCLQILFIQFVTIKES